LLKSDGTVMDLSGQPAGPANFGNSSIIAAGVSHGLADGNNVPPQARSQAIAAPANQDLTISLNASDANGDVLTYRVTILPVTGTLYQFSNGVRGALISFSDTVITDPGGRVIFVPQPNGAGKPYDAFSYMASDSMTDSPPASVSISIGNVYAYTQAATQISTSTATLNGMLLANGLASTLWFEWGGLGNYTNPTPSQDAGAASTILRVGQAISGLTEHGIYQCRLAVSNIAGIIYGSPVIFTTGLKITVWGGQPAYKLTPVPTDLTNIVAVAAGAYHSLALKSDGTVVAWGWNVYGQTNVPSTLSNVVSIAGGLGHSIALKSNGTVVAWGYNNYGQATVPSGLSNVVALAAGDNHNLALKSDGTVVG
jgi:hypothetical protein